MRTILVLPLLPAALCWGCNRGAGSAPGSYTQAEADAGTSASTPQVVALGRLEPESGVVRISALPGEQLLSLQVAEGDEVSQGDRLGELASFRARVTEVDALHRRLQTAAERWESQKRVARARLGQAEAALEQARAKLEEVELLKAGIPLLARQADQAKITYTALSQLDAEDPSMATDRELERYKLLSDQAEIDHQQAHDRYQLSKITAEKAVEAAEADVTAAGASLAQVKLADPIPELQEQLEIAELNLDRVDLRAPIDGTVMKIFMNPGEVVAEHPIMQLANLQQMLCIAEVYEADVRKIRVGGQATVISKAFTGRFAERGIRGTVEYVGSLVAAPGLQSRNPLAPVDRSVVEVRIRILEDQVSQAAGELTANAQAARLVGLQVKVEFEDAESDDDASVPP